MMRLKRLGCGCQIVAAAVFVFSVIWLLLSRSTSSNTSVRAISDIVQDLNRQIANRAGCVWFAPAQSANVTPTDFIPMVDKSLKFPTVYPMINAKKCISRSRSICKLLTYRSPTAEQRHGFLDLLHVVDNVSRRMHWTYFIAWGTLLGSWRHHGLIPWDRDVDIFMDLSHRDELLRVFSGSDYTAKKMYQPNYLIKFHNIFATELWEASDIGRMKWPYLDIFFYTGNVTHIWDIDPWRRSLFTFHRSDIFPLHKRPFEGLEFPAPKESLMILQKTYGTNGVCKGSTAQVQCSQLQPYIPFVHRKYVNNSMEETLIFNGKVLSTKRIGEKKEDLTEVYNLKRK